MARELQYQGLAELNVLINDTSKYSSEYFQVTNFPSVFTAGKNLFRFKGIADKFIEESDILIEVLDSNGQPIYYEADLNLESGEQSIIVAVYIDEETPPGSGEIILCGYLSDIVSEDETPTVRWRQPIDIDPTKQNDTEIIFNVLPAATVSTSSVVDSYTTTTYTNSALVKSASINNFTYDYRNNGNPVIIGTVSTAAITSLNVSGSGRFEVASSKFTGNPSSRFTLTATTLSASVSGYISTGSNIIFTLSDPFESGIQGSNQFHTFINGTGTAGSLYFDQIASSTANTENTYTIISASFTNLQPQVGNIAKIRTFYKSIGVGEYVLASETDILDIATEFGYTPESASIIVPLPTVHRNDRFDLKFQFLNSSEAVSKQVLYIKDVGMPGGNVYIGGDDNLITGSVYVAGQTGTGVSIEGSTEGAFIRSVGYEGFQNVVANGATGQPGFIMYSGSVATMLNSTQTENYRGIGLELTAHSESYLRYTTSGSGLLDIRTNKFFLGSSQQYIVGADGLIQISSSNFFLSSSGDVTMAGTITATAGNIGGFTITTHSLSGNNFFISGAATTNGFFISASKFNVKGNGDVTGSNVLFTGGRIGSFTLSNDAFTAGTTFFISSSVGGTPATAFFISSSRFNVRQDGTVSGSNVFFNGGKIAGFTLSNDTLSNSTNFFISGSATGNNFFISSSAFNVKANGDVTGSNVLFTGGKIASFALSNDALTAGSTFFISSSVSGTPSTAFFISSSRFNVRQDGTITGSNVLFNGGKVGGFTIDSSKITGTNIIIDSAGSIQTANYASDLLGWKIDASGNGTAEFENVKIRGTLSTAVFEKQSVNAVGGQLYVANSTTLTGSAEAGASPTGQYTATQTTMSVENVTGFEVGEIITAKKFSGTGFGTEYMRINSASRANTSSETDFSGRIYVTRGYGSGTSGASGSLGETPGAGQTYSGSQVIVSTGKLGTGFIRINANPNDQATPYIDIVERTGSGVYDVALKARLGDLSGLANSSYVFGNSNPGFGLATDNVFLQGGIIANTGSIGGINMQSSKLFTGTGTFNNTNTGFYLDSSGQLSLKDKLSWDGTNLNIVGDITVTNPDDFSAPRDKSTYVTALIASASGYTSFSSVTNPLFTQNGYTGAISSSVTGSNSITDISSGYDLYVIDYAYATATAKAQLILDLFDAGYSVFSNGNDTTTTNVTGSAGSEWPITAATSKSGNNWVSGSKATGIGGLPDNDPIGIGWTSFYTASWGDTGVLPTRLKTDMKGASICVPLAISGSTQPDAVPESNTTAAYTAFYATNPRGGRWFHTNTYIPRHIHPSASIKILDFLYRRDNAQEVYHNGFTKITGDMIQTGKIQSTNWTTGGSVGSQFNLNNGTFKLGGDASPKLSWDGTTLAVSGTLNAVDGNIGGFAITKDAITGSGFYLSGSATSTGFFISSSKFNIKGNGDVTGSNVLFTGGTVGGFTLSPTQLSSTNFLIDSSTGEIELGATSFAAGDGIYMSKTPTNNFRVGDAASSRMQFDGTNLEIYNSSNIKLVSIGNTNTIAGFTLSDNTLSNGSNFFISGSATGNGFFISASNFNIKANGQISGSRVLFDGGKIGGFSIDGNRLYTDSVLTGTSIPKIELNGNTGAISGSEVILRRRISTTTYTLMDTVNGYADFTNLGRQVISDINEYTRTAVFDEASSYVDVTGASYVFNILPGETSLLVYWNWLTHSQTYTGTSRVRWQLQYLAADQTGSSASSNAYYDSWTDGTTSAHSLAVNANASASRWEIANSTVSADGALFDVSSYTSSVIKLKLQVANDIANATGNMTTKVKNICAYTTRTYGALASSGAQK